jgi:hypothetical protein
MKVISKEKLKLFNFFFEDFFFKNNFVVFKKKKLKKNFLEFLNRIVGVKKTYFIFSKYKKSHDIIYIKGKKKNFVIKKEFLFKEKVFAKNFEELLKRIPLNFKYLIKPLMYKKKYIQRYKIYFFCIYPFFKGKYFDGSKKQVKIVAKAVLKVFNLLSKIKLKKNYNSFNYFKKNDQNIFKYYLNNKHKWKIYYDKEINLILKNNIQLIFRSWNYYKNFNFKKYHGIKTLCHSDIHPHNILVKKKTCMILDYSRLKYMPAGYSLSYSFFKLGKQIILKNKNKIAALKILYDLRIYYMCLFKKFKVNIIYLQDLALIEIIKRIINVLKILKKDHKNPIQFILPTLIKNFYECNIFFKIVK